MVETNLPTRPVAVMYTDIVGSMELTEKLKTSGYIPLLQRHNELLNQVIQSIDGAAVIKTMGDGMMVEFQTPSQCVCGALSFQHTIRTEPWDPEPIQVRIGLDFGEVVQLDATDRDNRDVLGPAANLASRVMGLAAAGQILMTSVVYSNASEYVANHPPVNCGEPPPLDWKSHGLYQVKGCRAPIEICEVGAVGSAPFVAPTGDEKAWRVEPDEDDVLTGWRPALGQGIPNPRYPRWRLERKLGEGSFGVAWLARQERLGGYRVFKFCFDTRRRRALERELKMCQLLKGALGDRSDILSVVDWELDEPPYFIATEYCKHGNLITWAESRGGVNKVPLPVMLDLVVRTAETVQAVHDNGIRHRDIKPSNIFINLTAEGEPEPCLGDFGIGDLVDHAILNAMSFTTGGFTASDVIDNEVRRAGTYAYLSPDVLMGKPFSEQDDVYALGRVLQQMAVGDFNSPVMVGWERLVEDQQLKAVIAKAMDHDPAIRYRTAQEFAHAVRAVMEKIQIVFEVSNTDAQGDDPANLPKLDRALQLDPDCKAAQDLRRRILIHKTATEMAFVQIKPGTFLMGSPANEDGHEADEQQHLVTLSKGFLLGRYPVTQAQWKAVMGTEPWKDHSYVREGDDYPAVYVNWRDAKAFCRKLSERDGRSYRLPTEAEWEYSCRAGTKTAYSFGDDPASLDLHGWNRDNVNNEHYPHTVGAKQSNAWQLYDMHCNVWEWCQDLYGDYPNEAVTDPVGPADGTSRVLRGGAWSYAPLGCRSACRSGLGPDFRCYDVGFRVALDLH